MKELATILDEGARLRASEAPFALATVAKINGSAYRQPGTRMLVAADGTRHGTISGGCLEDEVAQRALALLEADAPPTGRAAVVEGFDLSDDDLLLGFGIGCEGVIHMLIEAVRPGDDDPLRLVRDAFDRREPSVLATVIGGPSDERLGTRLLVHADDRITSGPDKDPLVDAIVDDANAALDAEQTQIATVASEAGAEEVLLEYLEPPVHLVVCGGGHDVRPVVRVARELGWRVTVVGRSAPDALQAKYPEATNHVFLMNPETIAEAVTLDARTPVVVMNHNFERDKTLVHALLQTPVPYVGALGPRYRTERMMRELRDDHALSDGFFDVLHGPVGLDLGTETPQEIALAIVAEIQAELSGRSAQKLREREAPIHERV